MFPSDALARLESTRARREEFWRSMIEGGGLVLVADECGAVVGFASFGADREDASVGELYAIYVLPEKWGGGAGRAIMADVLTELREAGFGTAVLWVLEDNPRARAFYEREGWALDGERREETFLETVVREVRYRIAL